MECYNNLPKIPQQWLKHLPVLLEMAPNTETKESDFAIW